MYPQRLPIVDSDDGEWGDILRKYLEKEHYNDDTNSASNGGHKNVTIRAGISTAGGAPLKFASGTLLTTPETGAVEFAGDNLYLTQTSGAVRKKFAIYDDASGATGDIYYRNTTGYFTRLAAGTASQILSITGGLPSWQTPNFVTRTTQYGQVYGTDWDTGAQTTLTYDEGPEGGTLAARYSDGRLRVGTPVDPADAVTKQYADNLASNVSLPYDVSIIAFGTYTARVINSYGDFPMGIKLQRAVTFNRVVYRVNTPDTSGNLVVQLRKNGATVSGTSATIAAANQVAGGTVTGSWSFADGDILTVYVTGVGTNPGTGLIADIRGSTS